MFRFLTLQDLDTLNLTKWGIFSGFLQSEEDSVFNTILDSSDGRMSNLIKPTLPQGHLSDDTNRSLFQL